MNAFKIILIIILSLTIIGVCIFVFTPYPAVYLLKQSYKKTYYTHPENYDALLKNVRVFRDINYDSKYSNATLDVITPKPFTEKNKVIFWVHGGSYIGGDKKDIEHYLVMLANEGYSIVNINYAVAPAKKYPMPLKQLEEAYVFAKENAMKYNLNFEQVYFGGDSAGAQIAAQFVNIQTNPEYAQNVNSALSDIQIKRTVPEQTIKGVILFCGPYNLKELIEPKDNTMLLPFKKIAWAYFNTKNPENINIELASITDKISENFPPTFITDGNTFSFENQAKDLENALQEKGVFVKSIYYPKEQATLIHEYQFLMDKDQAWETYNLLLEFLKK